ncbi:flagellar assembly protein FliH [Salinimonas chungwhensis]|uniref:flagellar assembly protein FliH n=1 Tax=Salinimonas chungwhensis TaxID=265425 RepID=UPI00037B0704|nr:flagellar assembly protein FliH [Salinimonas chungwhensis]
MSDYDDVSASNAKLWDLPFVDDTAKDAEQARKTNALNRRSDWKYEPPEEEEEIKPPTLQEIEAIRQSAQDEGYAEGKQAGFEEGKAEGLEQGFEEGRAAGHAEGLQQGLDEAKIHIDAQSEIWQSLADSLQDPLSQVTDESRQQLVQLAVALARTVIRHEVQTNEQVILQALAEGIKALPVNEKEYQIHMHPEDIALVEAHFGAETIAQKHWQLVESPALSRGGCDIVTTTNAVDNSIERRTREVLDKFLTEQGLTRD